MNITDSHFAPLTPQVFHILLAIAHVEQHGYHIREQIAYDTDGLLRVADGTLYPALQRLVAKGWIEAVDDEPKTYRLTDLGETFLRSELRRLKNATDVAERRLLARKYQVSERRY